LKPSRLHQPRTRLTQALGSSALIASIVGLASPVSAGPPFLTDDPDPTPVGHYEIFVFATGVDGDFDAETGIDFNYGAARDVQLSATVPITFEREDSGQLRSGFGNIGLGAKILVAHQETFGLNIAVYPTLELPAMSDVGEDHAAFFLPVWIGRHGENWSAFGGGGCALNRGGDSKDFCVAGLAVTRDFGAFEIGAELFHQTPDARDAAAATVAGLGLTYDVSEHLHVLAYAGAQLENRTVNGNGLGYASLLFTF
jgi:hypothetical protein